MPSLMYRSPAYYETAISLMHGFGRYEEIARTIGHGKRVLDVGSGTGLLARYLCSCNSYVGWELNETFIRHSRRQGLHINTVDVRKVAAFPEAFDVVVAIDIEHHVGSLPEDARLLRIEPPHDGPTAPRWFDAVFGDDDGINSYDKRAEWTS